ncbi:MAG: glycosyltransferase [Isosphaeraceae bacterium]|nr:glycosyltransferase [Isosphaeraceae bacterium]
MARTHDPRRFWSVIRVCLVPSLAAETQGLVATEAMTNGIPVVASDRGALPETLGSAGVILPLPARLTPSTRSLPTAAEVAPLGGSDHPPLG